jgi:hypothetical protein
VRIRTTICDRCQIPADVFDRVRIDRSGNWQFICPDCWQLLDRDNPDYVNGGTWKARKRSNLSRIYSLVIDDIYLIVFIKTSHRSLVA